ncbi:MAG: hypothetical protein ABIU11_00370 [Chitinophagaceae bacterium]
MKKISIWAKNHKWSARILIVLSFGILTIAGITTGILLDSLNITIPAAVLTISFLIYFSGIIFYPSKLERKKINVILFYKKQKTCDFILAASTFFMLICISNGRFRSIQYFSPLQAATASKPITPADSTVKAYKSIAAFSASLKNETGKVLKWKEKKKLLKEQVRAIKKSGELSQGAKVALIILSVIVALGLLYLVAALSCSISCGGSEAAAILVGAGGAVLVTFLLIITIRAILGKKKKKDIIPEEPVKTI